MALATAMALILTSCAGNGAGVLGLGAIVGNRTLAAAEPLFSKAEEGCVGSADQLLALVYGPKTTNSSTGSKTDFNCEEVRKSIRYALGVTSDDIVRPKYDDMQRNEIMDAMLATSNRKCTRYTALLKNADGAMNSGLSVGAILTGGLGSFVGGPAAAKALSGTASILSGSRAALNDVYLSNQTIQVLAAAFEKARRDQRRILTNRQACSVTQYTLMHAMEDAFAYHNSCSLVVGLAEAARSIERSENPGLDAMRSNFAALANLRRQAQEFGGDAPITAINPIPTPPSLEKVQAAYVSLQNAKKNFEAADKARAEPEANFNKGKLDLANGRITEDQLKNLEDKAKDAGQAANKARTLVAEAETARRAEVRALNQITANPAEDVPPETRVCPYQLGPLGTTSPS